MTARTVEEALRGIAERNELLTAPAPEFGEGVEFTFRTRLSVADVLALPQNFPTANAIAQNVLLFRLLVREPSGGLPALDEQAFAGVDALAVANVVARSGLRKRVFADLADEEAAKPAGGGKSAAGARGDERGAGPGAAAARSHVVEMD